MSLDHKNLMAFIVGLFIAAALLLPGAVWAAVTVSPTIVGYARDAVSGGYLNNSAGAGQALFDGATRSYGTSGTASIGGRALTIPAKIPIASTAGAAIKAGLRLNPWAIAGTLALPWLIDKGMDYLDGDFVVTDTPEGHQAVCTAPANYTQYSCFQMGALQSPDTAQREECSSSVPNGGSFGVYNLGDGFGWRAFCYYSPSAVFPTRPANDTDWDNLPDPSLDDGIAAEAPGADYMPKGVPVDSPVYQEGSRPLGDPYKAADGSTVQPMASVTNTTTNNNTVNITTYNTTTHNSAGEPIENPAPEPTDEKQDQCEKYPDSVGCAELGEYSETLEKETITMVFTPEASPISGSCPAPIALPNGGSLSWEPACNAMVQIKPIVLALAGMMTAFMVISVMRS